MEIVTRAGIFAVGALTMAATLLAAVASAAGQQRLPFTLPPGTVVAIRTIDPITSEGAVSSLEYRATIDDSIVASGATLVGVGTPAFLRVVRLQEAGQLRGRAGVTLRLVALEVDGRRIDLESGDASILSSSQGASAARRGVAGGIAGALIGGIIGGVDGAVQGGATGAAVGVTSAAIAGQRVQVPAETRLSFTLLNASVSSASVVGDEVTLAELLAMEQDGGRAAIAGNRDAVAAMLHPAFTANQDGKEVTRQQFLAMIKPQPTIVSARIDTPHLRMDGQRAVLTGSYIYELRRGRRSGIATQQFRNIFVKTDGRWLLLASDVSTR